MYNLFCKQNLTNDRWAVYLNNIDLFTGSKEECSQHLLTVSRVLGQYKFLEKYSEKEINNMMRKTLKVRIKDNLREILMREFVDTYSNEEDYEFCKKYSGKICNVYMDNKDYFICEDDNYVITKDCFDENTKGECCE
jgi:hypothetical protein